MGKINKSLDLNKLFQDQANGKLLKKHVSYPMMAGIKYDGNYTIVIKRSDTNIQFISSGGHIYTNNKTTIFDRPDIRHGVYICERIAIDGKLGDRDNCALRGTRGNQIAYGHKYMVHDFLTLDEYEDGVSEYGYGLRMYDLNMCNIPEENFICVTEVHNQQEADYYTAEVVKDGYEGIMMKSADWIWKDTKSRKVDNVKLKGRPTADLLCVGVTEGEGKYEGMIGALVLKDSQGRRVSVGSGLSDEDRHRDSFYFVGEVIEIKYERIADTYIQPTFIRLRYDKDVKEID